MIDETSHSEVIVPLLEQVLKQSLNEKINHWFKNINIIVLNDFKRPYIKKNYLQSFLRDTADNSNPNFTVYFNPDFSLQKVQIN